MKRVLIRRPGSHRVLEVVSEPDPVPGPGQISIRVRAAGVNYADCVVRMGYYEAAKDLYPITPGFEFAGMVEACGPGVTEPGPGQEVFGITRFGAYASRIVVEPWQVWPCPEGWTFSECAGFPAVFLTAYYGLFKAGRVGKGEILLIHSAAGGVGTALLQLSRIAGCRACAVVGSGRKAGLCRDLGAEAVIDRSSQDLWAMAESLAPKGFDAIFDSGGPATLKAGYRRLAPGGRLVVFGFSEMFPRGRDPNLLGLAWEWLKLPRFSPLDLTSSNRGVVGFNVVRLFSQRDLARSAMGEMLGWIKEGRLRKVPVAEYPLESVVEAHQALESGTTVGKLVLTV
ncbi:MAG: zinc-binding dehydrogenase [Elusimicrobia bacterium]|nr:zinc-binding dehydrogenase [Elusimicrobiota bacterium]